jgi:peptidoglycan/xylan/chitin deacetylase (PgdA/CDA1 family)
VNALVPFFRRLSPPGRRARLSILIFHRVLAVPDPLFPDLPDARRFGTILDWLRTWFNVLPLDQAVQRLRDGLLPERAAVVTFDDGYADNEAVALPELQRRGLQATFFIASGFLDGGCMWNDTVIEAVRGCRAEAIDLEPLGLRRFALTTVTQRRATIEECIARIKYIPSHARLEAARRIADIAGVRVSTNVMLTSDAVRRLHRADMHIGAHTITHPILARLPVEDAVREMQMGRAQLEGIIGAPVNIFAYPNGKWGEDYGPEHADLARGLGFEAAVSTNPGAAAEGCDLMQLPRFTPWDRTQLRFGMRLLANLRARSPHAGISDTP